MYTSFLVHTYHHPITTKPLIMARLFSINFYFEDELHSAFISVRTTPFFTEYNLSMLDGIIEEQLPNTKIISTNPQHLYFLNMDEKSSPLMNVL